ncbi:Hypothetical protein CINCED_3A007774 [Cinara cedri]|uniref:Winged helix-turn-helix DNA-binding domain n=1 Tax=Cinara cedri TaxID=506608 RepID=A0A5E4NGS2_9HEMI|nr:Hypothetical protein CINCED_3A007774 [Cinara cedri]
MELNREHFRAIIYYDLQCGLNPTTVRGRRSLRDEFREGSPKSVVLPENIKAVRDMIKLDRHVTYHEIEAFLGMSSTSVHSKLHRHLVVKKMCSRWIPHNLILAQKKCSCRLVHRHLEKYSHGTSKDVYTIVTNHGFMRMIRKINGNRLFGSFKKNKKKKLRGKRFPTPEEAVDAFKMHVSKVSGNWSERSGSKIGSNACKSVLISVENILKNNKTIFND